MLKRCRTKSIPLLLLLALTGGAAGAATSGGNSELERELYRELHKMPPAAVLPSPETLACYERLRKIAHFTPMPIKVEPAQCARFDMVRIDRVVMPDQKLVAVTPSPSLQCSMAEAVAEWVRDDVGPAVAELGAPLASVSGYDSYECRPRNNVPGALLSEHGKGNALDVGAVKLANGAVFTLTDPLVSRPFRERMRVDACARFTTVLGPGSDGYHNDHIHLDLAERRGGYRLCQWNVLDPPAMAGEVPLPRPRPTALTANEPRSRERLPQKKAAPN